MTFEEGPPATLVIRFSLSPENDRFVTARKRIFGLTAIVTLATALAVVAMSRRLVVLPIRKLARAAHGLEHGRVLQVEIQSRDEVGQLARGFASMTEAIVDRERRLGDLNRQLQQLLDHMREAIVVFGPGGRLAAVRSREASLIFEHVAVEGVDVRELLYPKSSTDVGGAAFDEWIRAAFSLPADAWAELEELAPKEVVLNAGTDRERVLSLDFRAIDDGGKIARVMMLAKDETEVRRLAREVREQGEEHERQMAAMRKLVAGGGQLLLSVLDRARERIAACEKRVRAETGPLTAGLVEELFQHAHSVKGEARAFDLAVLETASAELEDLLAILRGRLREGRGCSVDDVRGQLEERLAATRECVGKAAEMLVQASPIGAAILEQVTVQRSDVKKLLAMAGGRNDELGRLVTRIASRPFGEALLGLAEAVPRWAEREGKRVQLEVDGRDVLVPPDLARALPDVLTHLVRNALAHGIEESDERVRAEKPAIGRIRISCAEGPNGPTFTVEDDGSGLDEGALQAAAERLGLAHASGGAAELAFREGLSTAAPSALAGHGVGLGTVRADLDRVGYDVVLERPSSGLRIVMKARVRAKLGSEVVARGV
jgi:HAMP domain-containing protein